MTVLGPLLVLALAAVAAIAGLVGGPVAVYGVGLGVFIASVPFWIPFQAAKSGDEKEYGKAILTATVIRFLSALVVVLIVQLSQPKPIAKAFLVGMAASYIVLLAAETFYFAKRRVTKSADSTPVAS